MTDYAALKAEIAKPAYNGMTTAQKAAAVNALSVNVLKSLSPTDAMMTLARNGDWGWMAGVASGKITSANASGGGAVAVANTAPWTTWRTAQTLVDLFKSGMVIDMTVQANVDAMTTALNTLVTANVITSASRSALAALASVATPWWQVRGWSQQLTEAEITAAELWNG